MSNEILKSMLNNLINDNHAQADMDLHNYLTDKMKQVAGTAPAQEHIVDDDINDDINEE